MLVTKPNLHAMARAALIEIQAAGVEITPDIVLWVHDAATQIRKTPHRPVADLVDWPVSCGGVLLRPLTFGAVSWLQRLPERMRHDVRTVAYAMAHGTDAAALLRLHNTLLAVCAVSAWASRLTCSPDALEATVDDVLGVDAPVEVADTIKPKHRDRESWQWGAVVRALCGKFPGTTPEYWTWQVSRDTAYTMLQQSAADLPDDDQPTDHEVEAQVALRNIVAHIIAEGKSNG